MISYHFHEPTSTFLYRPSSAWDFVLFIFFALFWFWFLLRNWKFKIFVTLQWHSSKPKPSGHEDVPGTSPGRTLGTLGRLPGRPGDVQGTCQMKQLWSPSQRDVQGTSAGRPKVLYGTSRGRLRDLRKYTLYYTLPTWFLSKIKMFWFFLIKIL